MQRKHFTRLPAAACAALFTVAPAQAQVVDFPATVFDQPLATPIYATMVSFAREPTKFGAIGGEYGLTTTYNGPSYCTGSGIVYGTAPVVTTGDPFMFGGVRICLRHTTSAEPGRTTVATAYRDDFPYPFRATTAGPLHPDDDADGDAMPNGVEPGEGRDPRVKDNDIFANARLFAMQQYRDFFGREGEGAGVLLWTERLTMTPPASHWTRPMVIDAFLSSAEFEGTVAPVARLYFATYQRLPDFDGLVHNAGLVRSGATTTVALADFFASSPEFAATYGSLDNTAFVTLLYNNVLGRAPDAGGLAGWVALLEGGQTRGQVLWGFSESPEHRSATANEVFVTMMYAGMLRRSPEPAGYASWVAWLDAGSGSRELVVGAFFESPEYRARFLP